MDRTVVALLDRKWEKWGKLVCTVACLWTILHLAIMDAYCVQYVKVLRLRERASLDADWSTELAEKETALTAYHLVMFGKAILSMAVVLVDTAAAGVAQRSYQKEVLETCSAKVQKELVCEMQRLRNQTMDDHTKSLDHKIIAATKRIRANERRQVSEFSKRDMFVFTKYTYAKIIAALLVITHWSLLNDKRDRTEEDGLVFLALAIPLSHFTFLQFISVASPQMGYLLIILSRALRYDVTRFLLVWSVMALGFGVGLHLINGSQEEAEGTFVEQFLQLYRVTLGEKPPWGSTLTAEGRDWVTLFYVMFTIFSTVVLIRMLICMFNETYIGARSNADAVWRIERGYVFRCSFACPSF